MPGRRRVPGRQRRPAWRGRHSRAADLRDAARRIGRDRLHRASPQDLSRVLVEWRGGRGAFPRLPLCLLWALGPLVTGLSGATQGATMLRWTPSQGSMNMNRLIIVALALTLPSMAQAIYKCKAAGGGVTYSDLACANTNQSLKIDGLPLQFQPPAAIAPTASPVQQTPPAQ